MRKGNSLTVAAFVLIFLSIISLASSNIAVKRKTTVPEFFPILATAPASIFYPNWQPLPTLTPTLTPTPTPAPFFHHQALGFSLDLIEETKAEENNGNAIKFVENSIGGVFLKKENRFEADIAVVSPNGLSLDQYANNRLAMIYDATVVKSKTATTSSTLSGFEVKLRKFDNKKNYYLIFLPFRGNQYFEIEAVCQNPQGEQLFRQILNTLKPY